MVSLLDYLYILFDTDRTIRLPCGDLCKQYPQNSQLVITRQDRNKRTKECSGWCELFDISLLNLRQSSTKESYYDIAVYLEVINEGTPNVYRHLSFSRLLVESLRRNVSFIGWSNVVAIMNYPIRLMNWSPS